MKRNSLLKDLASQKSGMLFDDRSAHPNSSLGALDINAINKTIIEEEISDPSN